MFPLIILLELLKKLKRQPAIIFTWLADFVVLSSDHPNPPYPFLPPSADYLFQTFRNSFDLRNSQSFIKSLSPSFFLLSELCINHSPFTLSYPDLHLLFHTLYLYLRLPHCLMAEGKFDLPDDLLPSKPFDRPWTSKGTHSLLSPFISVYGFPFVFIRSISADVRANVRFSDFIDLNCSLSE